MQLVFYALRMRFKQGLGELVKLSGRLSCSREWCPTLLQWANPLVSSRQFASSEDLAPVMFLAGDIALAAKSALQRVMPLYTGPLEKLTLNILGTCCSNQQVLQNLDTFKFMPHGGVWPTQTLTMSCTIPCVTGNGFPLGAVVTTPALAAAFAAGGMEYFNTYGGNNAAVAAGRAVLREIQDKQLRQHAAHVGR
eukprot:GHRR01017451.1.p1 GENE.GHRR01017451.1~~GHRR01017451.1.p1  ORF type:complete len:194 (+),score=61.26 GHRR01017451.1:1569-2150(+)